MGSHPINLAIRFLLEVAALIIAGTWGWKIGSGWYRYFLVVAVPLLMATMWGVFSVPHDPSRSGNAPIAVPGFFRLFLELAFFGT